MVLYKLNKKWAKTNVIFEENLKMDPVDKWFIDVKGINKLNIVKSIHTILKKDIDNWLNIYLNDGWKITEKNKK